MAFADRGIVSRATGLAAIAIDFTDEQNRMIAEEYTVMKRMQAEATNA